MALRKALALTALMLLPAFADEPPDPARPPGARPHRVHALVDARVVTRPGEELARATVLIRDGRIEAVGDVAVPGDARVWDMRGLTIYPGLIEPYYAPEDVPPEPKGEPGRRGRRGGGGEEGDLDSPSKKGAGHYAPEVRPERSIAAEAELPAEALRELRKAGFTVALLAPGKGILRGTSAAVCLRDGSARQQVLRADVAQHLAFAPRSDTTYPSSLMGAMSLVRQTLLDAEHHAAASAAYAADPMASERPEANRALEALRPVLTGERPLCMQAEDAASLLRGAAVLAEFDLVPWAVLGNADAYRWLDELQGAAVPLVLSLNFPPVPEWDGPDEALEVETRALHHWWLAPECPARMEQAQLRFAFTSHGLVERGSWRARVREAVTRGLSEETALAALTTAPAALLGLSQVGVVAPGALANLTIADGPLFAEETRLVEVWVDGERYPSDLVPPSPEQLAGRWTIELQLTEEQVSTVPLRLTWEKGAMTAAVDTQALPAGAPLPASVELAPPVLVRDQLELRLPPAQGGVAEDGPLVRARVVGRRLVGTWRAGAEEGAARGSKLGKERGPEEKPAEAPRPVGILPWPAWPPHPEPASAAVLVRGATIWTQGPAGTFVGDLLCQDGLIAAVGTTVVAPPEALVVDGKGLHVSPGMIDCHNHSYVVGDVNEASRSCTSMVRIADVLDPETIRIYQHLAGGLTCANVLHGSANAIGGQNAVVKLRWGQPPGGLLFEEAPQGIKWALGENPKRANWGQNLSPRYPTTRMGVVESIRERLTAARDYLALLEAWQREPRGTPPRIDLELQALGEILEGTRLVHCHSYRQDEILAVIRLAEQLGFTVGTFQHVLEGYKVADEIAAHGAGASSFSDWWSYKFEVIDAIAYSPALMVRRGVLVSVNSDSNELARRLNQEAAKSMRWGGLSAEESLALVTLNPAKQLGVGDLTGSLEPGKQADFVVWSASPLSTRAVCLETWIDGRRLFQLDRDRAAWATGQLEREALLAAAAAARWAEGARRAKDWRRTFGAPTQSGHDHEQGCCTGGDR